MKDFNKIINTCQEGDKKKEYKEYNKELARKKKGIVETGQKHTHTRIISILEIRKQKSLTNKNHVSADD